MNSFFGIPIPTFCEQIALGFIAEPLNAFSNLAFILAAIGIFKLLAINKIQKLEYKLVLLLVFLTGVGSFLWHATRTPFGLILDAVPTALSFTLVTFIFLEKLISNKALALLIVLILLPTRFIVSSFASTDVISSLIRHSINAGGFLIMILWAFKKYGRIALEGFGVLAIYLLAIIMRMIDSPICQTFQTGTHFLWHIFSAVAAYSAVKFLIKLEINS